MRRYRHVLAQTLAATALCGGLSPVSGETLREALIKAYQHNPTLTAARADLRATDENVPIAKANGLPNAGLQVNFNDYLHQDPYVALTNPNRSFSTQANVSVPLYNGGTVRNSITAAKLRVEAGQGTLRGTESTIFSRAVGAYLDVIRDSAIVTLNSQNVKALEVNLQASRDRFEVGDVTRTDVAQSESRLALARADLERAQAQLIASKESYTALIGTPPAALEAPPALPGLPDSPDAAVSVALSDNPDIQAAQKNRDAARYDVKATKGQVLPHLSAFAQGGYQDFLGSDQGTLLGYSYARSAAVGGTVTLPLYQGGRPAAQERQAVAKESSAIEQSVGVERDTISQVRAAYAAWKASILAIESTEQAVKAAELSLEGVKAENSVGTRTVLDILNAEQEALNARVQLVSARRNAYVAAFTLLATMGRAEARDLGIDPAIFYDADANYRRVRGKLIDFDFDPHPTAQATPTSSSPAQDATPITVPGY
jgi:outer membrane protein